MSTIAKKGTTPQLLELQKKVRYAALCKEPPADLEQAKPPVNADEIEDEPRQLNKFVVKVSEGIFYLDEDMEAVVVNSGLCNHPDITSCHWNECTNLMELCIGDKCLQNVQLFELKNMELLEKVEIGSSCFTKTNGRMEVSECDCLRSMKIGKKSCAEWNEFVMRKCSVKEVDIGEGCFTNCQNEIFEGKNDGWD